MKDYEPEVVCDLAETYGIYDYRAMPARLVATLVMGLRPGSRLYMKLSGFEAPYETVMLAMCVDKLSFLAWAQTEDAQRGQGRPEPIAPRFLPERKVEGAYATAEDFEAARRKLLRRIKHG